MRLLRFLPAVLGLLPIGCELFQDSCVIEDVLDRRVGTTSVRDCGRIANHDEALLRTAHDCVAGALADNVPFAVLWDRLGVDSRVAGAWVGLPSEAGLALWELSYDDIGGPWTRSTRCEALRDPGTCTVDSLNLNLCFECANPGSSTTCSE